MPWLLWSFDPNLKNEKVTQYQNKFGKESVLLIQRSKLFLFLKIIVPLIIYMLIYAGIIVAISYGFEWDREVIGYSAIIGFLVIFLIFLSLNLKRLLDYLMDFIIVTPEQIIAYNQRGIRKRSNMTIECVKIKSISTSYRSRLFSLFNNGDIKFLSEGDSHSSGEIKAFYVHEPQKTKEKIYNIMEKANIHSHPAVND